jgi:zinc protease
VYQLQVPTDDPTLVATGLDILHQWAGSITFAADEVEKERGVVLEEWRLRRGAWSRVWEQQAAVLYGGTRYADRYTIGKPEILKTAPREALTRYYQDWYRPDLMAVIVVGDVDPAAMAKDIEAKFADLKSPATPRARISGGALKSDGLKVSILRDSEMTSAQVSIDNLFPHRRESTETDYRQSLLDTLYHTMLNERLVELARRPDAPFRAAWSSTGDRTREIEAFSRSARAKPDRVEDTLVALITEVARVEQHGFTETELARAKRAHLRYREQAAREQSQRDGRAQTEELLRHFFEGELVIGRDGELALSQKLIPGITLAELNHLAKAWGGDDNRAVLITGPDDLVAPTEARVRELVAAAATATVEPWVDDAPGDTLMATPPTAGTITAEKSHPDGITEWTLSNGARVIVKPTDFDADTVLLRAFSPGGTAVATDKQWPSARYATYALGGAGVGELSPGMLQKILTGRIVSASPWMDETTEGVWGSSSALDLETQLQLVHLRMTAPRRDEALFGVWKASMLEWVKNRRKDPDDAFYEDMGVVVAGGHKRRKPPEVADIEAIDLDQALAFYNDRFGDASDFTFVFVGNVDLATFKPLVETYLASLPGKGRVEREKDLKIKRPKGKTEKTVVRGIEPKSYVYLTFHGAQKWTRDAERDLGTLAEVLDVRLREVLREDMGGVYGVGVWGDFQRKPRQEWTFSINFGCAPENVDKLKAAIFTEVARLQKEGIADSYLTNLKAQRVRAREVSVKSNGAWASWIVDAFDHGDDLADVLDLDAALARYTSDHVKAAAKTYLGKQYVFGVLKPETEKAK